MKSAAHRQEAGHAEPARGVTWDLSDLYPSGDAVRIDADQAEAEARAEALAGSWRGKLASLSPAGLSTLLTEYECILELGQKPLEFAYLSWATASEQPARGALLQKVTERWSRVSQKLVFFELEWAGLPEDSARALLEAPAVARWRHWLETARRYKPYLLTEPEEKILQEKSVTGRQAWVRYFDETSSAARFDWEGGNETQAVMLEKLYNPDRDIRRRAATSLTRGLKELARTATYVFNTILADKASDDRLRGYPSWISARNMDNQVEDSMVDALVGAVTARYDIVARYYRLKKRLLGVDELFDYDRYAPLQASERTYAWAEARETVLSAFGGFHPRMAETAALFFEKGWIDAEVKPGKRGGAFASPTVPSVHPYILLSFQGRTNDVMTLAHELGHGVHQYLARGRGILQQNTPLTTAETASGFGEALVFQALMAKEGDPKVRLSMLVREIEGTFASVFRQVAMNRFEDSIHAARRRTGELTTDELSSLWLSTQRAMFGGSVTLRDEYGIWWSYIPHFLHTPGYVYAYAFGDLLVQALFSRSLSAGAGFAEKYLSMLSAGGSDWPHRLTEPLGVDLTDPLFWKQGLGLVERMVDQAEKLAGG